MENKLKLGKEYEFAGYRWVPVCINEDRQIAIMQSLGVTSGPWPGFSMEKFGNGDYYGKDIAGQDISDYDDKTRNLAEQIQPVVSNTGLYLPSYENIEDDSVWKDAFAKAADDYSSFGADFNYAWLGTVYGSNYAWYVVQNGYVGYNLSQNHSFVVAPAFNLDLSKVEIEGNEIIINSSEDYTVSDEVMTLEDFLENYRGVACISIDGYCEEKYYDYYHDVDDDELSDDNPNHYKPTCITKESWWNEVKDREIEYWNIIGGGIDPIELTITLKE